MSRLPAHPHKQNIQPMLLVDPLKPRVDPLKPRVGAPTWVSLHSHSQPPCRLLSATLPDGQPG
eukprot:11399-Rhodomonas_salina.3